MPARSADRTGGSTEPDVALGDRRRQVRNEQIVVGGALIDDCVGLVRLPRLL
jgi:hypothetical protein